MKKIASLIGCIGLAALLSGSVPAMPRQDAPNMMRQDREEIMQDNRAYRNMPLDQRIIDEMRKDFESHDMVFLGTVCKTGYNVTPGIKTLLSYTFANIKEAKSLGVPNNVLRIPLNASHNEGQDRTIGTRELATYDIRIYSGLEEEVEEKNVPILEKSLKLDLLSEAIVFANLDPQKRDTGSLIYSKHYEVMPAGNPYFEEALRQIMTESRKNYVSELRRDFQQATDVFDAEFARTEGKEQVFYKFNQYKKAGRIIDTGSHRKSIEQLNELDDATWLKWKQGRLVKMAAPGSGLSVSNQAGIKELREGERYILFVKNNEIRKVFIGGEKIDSLFHEVYHDLDE